MSTLPLETLAALARHRWTVPLIAAVAERKGARYVELLHRLKISRESLTRALDQARRGGWIVRNPGHGHPLRPEYVVAPDATEAAQACQNIAAACEAAGIPPASLGRWALPVLRVLADGADRFNAIERALGTASPRALTLTLKALAEVGLVEREIVPGWPPATRYALTARGARIASADPGVED